MANSKRNKRYRLKRNLSGTSTVQLPGYSMGGNILSGAAAGAAAGSVIPPWGTVVGAVVGAGLGLWGGIEEKKAKEKQKDQLAQQDADQRNAMLAQKRLGEYEADPNYMSVYAAYGAQVPPNNELLLDAQNRGVGNPILYDASTSKATSYQGINKGQVITKTANSSPESFNYMLMNENNPRLNSREEQQVYNKWQRGELSGDALRSAEFFNQKGYFEPYKNKEFAVGGMQGFMPQQGLVPPNAEVEGGETVETPSGQEAAVVGPSHEQGGVQTFLPPGSKVYSDRLRNPLTGNTFADDHATLTKKIDKQEKKLYDTDEQLTRLEKDTLELNIKNLEKKQEQLFQLQQSLNNDSNGQQGPQMNMPGQPPQGMPNMSLNGPQMAPQGPSIQPPMPMGAYGLQMPKYGNGGSSDGIPFSQLPPKMQEYLLQIVPGGTAISLSQSEFDYLNGLMESGEIKNMNPKQVWSNMQQSNAAVENATEGLPDESAWAKQELLNPTTTKIPMDSIAPEDLINPQYAFNSPEYQGADQIGTGTEFDTMLNEATNATVKSGPNWDKVSGIVGGVASIAPMLWNIGEGIFGKHEEIEAPKIHNYAGLAAAAKIRDRNYNIDPLLQANRSAYATAVRNLAGRSRGEQLASMSTLMGAKSKMDASAYAQKYNAENQYANQAASMLSQTGIQTEALNARYDYMAQDWNARSKAAQKNMLGTGLTQASQYSQSRELRNNLMERDKERMGYGQQMFAPYLNLSNTGGWTVNDAYAQQFYKPTKEEEEYS